MTNTPEDTGVVVALIERFEKQRLPRATALKAKVDRGGVLSDEDMTFLNPAFEDARHVKPFVHEHPEWQPLVIRAVEHYKAIMDKALANERAAQVKKP